MAHTVSDYFEVLKMRYPSLFLLRDELEKTDIKDLNQLESATINAGRSRGGNAEARAINVNNNANREAEIKKKNLLIFDRAFPGQKKYQLGQEKKSTRVDISLLPDTYFVTFLVNVMMVIAVLVFFFTTRTVSEEFFIRKNINNVFEKDSLLYFLEGGEQRLEL